MAFRPPHVADPVDRRRVEAMAGYGIPEADIARVLGIAPSTLRKHYHHELATGHIVTNAKVAESLFRKATGDHRQAVTAAIFWLKTRARWKDVPRQDSDGDEPVTVRIVRFADAPAPAEPTAPPAPAARPLALPKG